MVTSAVTAVILPFTASSSHNDNVGRNGRLFFEFSYNGDLTCVALEYADILTCHDTISEVLNDQSATSMFEGDTSFDYCGWCNGNTTANDEFTGNDIVCY